MRIPNLMASLAASGIPTVQTAQGPELLEDLRTMRAPSESERPLCTYSHVFHWADVGGIVDAQLTVLTPSSNSQRHPPVVNFLTAQAANDW